jgi:hypothetical protein
MSIKKYGSNPFINNYQKEQYYDCCDDDCCDECCDSICCDCPPGPRGPKGPTGPTGAFILGKQTAYKNAV